MDRNGASLLSRMFVQEDLIYGEYEDDPPQPEVEIFFDRLGMKGWGAEAVFNAGVFSMERLKKQTMDDLLDMKFDESRCKRILDELGRQAVRVPRVMLHVDFHVDLRVCVELLVAVRSRV